MKHIISRTALAVSTAAAVAFVGPVGASIVATMPAAVAQAQVDVNHATKLTIKKYEGEPIGEGGSLDGMKTIKDVTFKVERIADIAPLNTAQGWEDVATAGEKKVADLSADPKFTAKEVATNADGEAVFTDLGVGLFRVTELRAEGAKHSVATPFLLTLPVFENGEAKYERTISPKNQILEPKKSLISENTTLGDKARYRIDAPIPAFGPNPEGDQLRVVDTLSANLKWSQAEHPVQVQVLKSANDKAPETLAAGTHYTVADAGGNTIDVTFTEKGLQKLRDLRAAHPGLTVRTEFDATLVDLPANGTIDNTAQVYYSNDDKPHNTTPTDDPDGGATTLNFANVEVTKLLNKQAKDGEKNGAGAQFQIFTCTKQGDAWKVEEGTAAQRVVIGGKAETTLKADETVADGEHAGAALAKAKGLNLTKKNNTFADYCAVETKGVPGYLNNPEPQPLTYDEATKTLTGSVNNVKDNLFGRLPATGERTMLIILALGVVLFGGGAVYQLRSRKA
ncbi:SpaH/EbpB family LPXTG-anchored major pilin [Corynebacterium sp. MC-17D]|uniref:SpaH/EbpB family LPXTG-anchored major pilin n=1 Tax=Corynebacterium lipophilum TaxID=2804918 RepID=A0AAW5HXQ3_9CORY|nr:SpaH/EbpB family LPXTG-anchored major pilin [Corynebacterium lipophilum]MCO6394655.1 SpaH/EbpB family LPXTG-anchored major pilin [Corynebacterium lipophilum]MCZ2117228.1 SpaH/EbpB family LPXTG-anchored major pilin [Corynebacterium lipophilum]